MKPPAKPDLPVKVDKPLPAFFSKPLASANKETESPEPYAFKNPPTIIKPPQNTPREFVPPQRLTPLVRNDGPTWETFDEPEETNLYDPIKSASEAEKDLQEFFASNMDDKNITVTAEDMEVKGFAKDIRLLPPSGRWAHLDERA